MVIALPESLSHECFQNLLGQLRSLILGSRLPDRPYSGGLAYFVHQVADDQRYLRLISFKLDCLQQKLPPVLTQI
jgi:hypothetical protein